MNTEPNQRAVRATKRYPYACDAECSIDGVVHALKIINISTSGIQFATRNKIESKNEMIVRWKDSHFGDFQVSFAIAREIHNPNSHEYPFFYGAQYFNLNDEMRNSLLRLLKNFKDETTRITKERVEKITPGYLFSVIEQGVFFIKNSMETKNMPEYFGELMSQMPDYEKTSFSLADDYSKQIQKMATGHFHADILKSLADLLKEQPELHMRYFQKIESVLQQIGRCAEDAPLESAKIKSSQFPEDLKKKLINQLSESGNRLYYSAQGMLDHIIRSFDLVVKETSPFKDIYHQIKQAHVQKKPQQPNAQPSKYERKKKPAMIMEDFSQVEKIIDAREERIRDEAIAPHAPSRNSPRLLVLLLLVGASYFAYDKFDQMKRLDAFVKEMNLGVPLKSFAKMGSQLNLFFVSTDWGALTDEKKMEVYQKIQEHLMINPKLSNALLFDDRQNTLRFINESMKIQ